jgi:16S rRNA processing protein RimM
MPSGEWIAIGIVRKPVGLEGLCAVEPFGATLASLSPPCSICIGRECDETEDMVIDTIVPLPKGLRCGFRGRKDRAAVEGLRGSLIFIEKEKLPVRGEGSYYHFELKGAGVFSDRDGSRIGTVVEVHNYPASDTLEVEREGGSPLLLPLAGQAVAAIDAAGGRITVRQSFIEELLQ